MLDRRIIGCPPLCTLDHKTPDVLNKKAIIIIGYVLFCYAIEGAELV